MLKLRKRIIVIVVLIVLCFIVWIFRNQWPACIRNYLGYYTLSEAMQTESYGLIAKVVGNLEYDTYEYPMDKTFCKPKLEHIEVAVKKEWRNVVQLFLEYGANPNEFNDEGYTLLDKVIISNSFEMCEVLLDNSLECYNVELSSTISTEVNKKNKYENTALDELCTISNEKMLEGEWERRIQFLLEHGAKVSDKTRSLLQGSVHKDKITWIESLLQGKDKKTNIDFAKDDLKQIKQKWKNKTFTKEECYNLLKNLQIYGSTETIRLLLDDLQIQKYLDNNQKEELMEMAARDNTDVVTIYLEKEFPVTSKALGECIWSKNFDEKCFKKLVTKDKQKIIVENWKDNQDYSLFMIAVEADADVVSELYYNKANLNYKNNKGLTALKISKKYNFDILDKLTTVGPNYFKGETEGE